jgi:hypothetical protein
MFRELELRTWWPRPLTCTHFRGWDAVGEDGCTGPLNPIQDAREWYRKHITASPSFKMITITNPLSLYPVQWLTPPWSGLCTAGSPRSVSTHYPQHKPRRPRIPAGQQHRDIHSTGTNTTPIFDARSGRLVANPGTCACPEAHFCGHFHQFALAKPWLTILMIPWHLHSIARCGCQVPGLPVETELA